MLAQQISQIAGVGPGASIGGQQKPAVRIQVDPAKLVGHGPVARGRARPARHRQRSMRPKGTHRRRDAQLHHLRQRPADRGATPWNDVIVAYRERRAGPRRATSARPSTGPENTKLAAWANGKRGVFLTVFKQPGANVIETVDRIKAQLPPPRGGDAAGHQGRRPERPHADDPRLGRTTCEFTLLLTIALVVLVIFVFLRSSGRPSSRASRCRWRCSAPSR